MDPLESILRLTERSTLSNKLGTGSAPREITFKVYVHWIPNQSQRKAVNWLSSLSRGGDNAQAKELGGQFCYPSSATQLQVEAHPGSLVAASIFPKPLLLNELSGDSERWREFKSQTDSCT